MIRVEGNLRTPEAVILNTIRLKEGGVFSSAVLQDDIKRLYDKHLFQNILVDRKDTPSGIELTFILEERYLIKEVDFTGNRTLKARRLKREMVMAEGNLFDQAELKRDKEALVSLYRKEGFAEAEVDDEIKKDEEKRELSLVFNIVEGRLARVSLVKVEGNTAFSDRQIWKKIKTGRRDILRKRPYSEEILKEDKYRIIALYNENGYINAKILKTELQYDKTAELLTVIFFVDEGDKYLTGKILLEEDFRIRTELSEGMPFNPEQLRKDIRSIYDYLYEKGYLYAQVRAERKVDEEGKKVNLEYSITRGILVYVEEVKISGNIRTKTEIIRRELEVKPGERFDFGKIKKSQKKLRNLGTKQPFFEKVDFEIEPGSAVDKRNIHFRVTEGQIGTLLVGAGYSTEEDFLAYIEVNIENFDITDPPTFLGGGQSLSIGAELGTIEQYYVLNFYEPWLLGKPVSFGLDIYDTLYEWDVYDEARNGGKVRFGRSVGEDSRLEMKYRFEDVEILDLAEDVSEEISREEGAATISSLGASFIRDTRDNFFDPREGIKGSISAEVAGHYIGGDVDFVKNIANLSYYHPVSENTTLNLRLKAGLVKPYGDSDYVPIYERFYMGGASSVRGYAYRDVGPKDENGEPVGGEVALQGNVEYLIPVVKNVKAAIFYDVGNVWASTGEVDLGELFSGVGVGIRFLTPVGPVRLDYGYGIDIGKGRVHFTMGWPF